jgi:hypothetical protein
MGRWVLLLLLSTAARAQIPPAPPLWQLAEIKLVTADVTQAIVTQKLLSKDGGFLQIQLSGKLGGVCPDGFELLNFEWKFDGKIGTFSLDLPISATLKASQAARFGRCALRLAASSFMALTGTSGFAGTLDPTELLHLDADQTWPGEAVRVWAARGGQPLDSAHPAIRAGRKNIYPDRTRAAFCIDIQTPGGRFVVYYFYDRK